MVTRSGQDPLRVFNSTVTRQENSMGLSSVEQVQAVVKVIGQAMYDMTHAMSILNGPYVPNESVKIEAVDALSNGAKEILFAIDMLGDLWDIDTTWNIDQFGFDPDKVTKIVEEYAESQVQTEVKKSFKSRHPKA